MIGRRVSIAAVTDLGVVLQRHANRIALLVEINNQVMADWSERSSIGYNYGMDREQLFELGTELRALIDRHGARSLSVFGSVARGEAGPDSDVDLLVDFPCSPTFEQFMDLKLALEDLLQCPVDLITRSGLRPELRPRIEAEAVGVA